jgi:polyphosphate glucokinase
VTTTRSLGIDIGGSGMKAAMVDPRKGVLLTDRFRISTPTPASPASMTDVVAELVEHFAWSGAVGCTFPGVVKRRAIIGTAANLDPSWVGVDAQALFGERTGCRFTMINDADAAGLAEIRIGAGRSVDGVVLLVTVGTGLGTALFNDGRLVPNTEFGHIEIAGVDAEERASARAKKAAKLSMKAWAKRLSIYLQHLEALLSPDLFIIGGGISKRFDDFSPWLAVQAKVVPATLRNHAGIVGAAMAIDHRATRPSRAR